MSRAARGLTRRPSCRVWGTDGNCPDLHPPRLSPPAPRSWAGTPPADGPAAPCQSRCPASKGATGAGEGACACVANRRRRHEGGAAHLRRAVENVRVCQCIGVCVSDTRVFASVHVFGVQRAGATIGIVRTSTVKRRGSWLWSGVLCKRPMCGGSDGSTLLSYSSLSGTRVSGVGRRSWCLTPSTSARRTPRNRAPQ